MNYTLDLSYSVTLLGSTKYTDVTKLNYNVDYDITYTDVYTVDYTFRP